jgi:ubiquinone/menaquinone biosynthesis C-methylase UbiE
VGILLALSTLTKISNTLDRLTVVESERDRWQRSPDILRALGVREGSTVVDLGSGAGYFTLKLAEAVGERGTVIAVDLRRLSLFFLRLRALLGHRHNIQIIVGAMDDPKLPSGKADAVLIANTYHEFSDPRGMLDRVFRSLRTGGRLVIVDRALDGAPRHAHGISRREVEESVRASKFDVISRDDRFAKQPGEGPWWLLVAQRR